ncbi:hypothetical protein KDM41_00005, partial [bacterium]|nr:hypothetical protein [bacterium]
MADGRRRRTLLLGLLAVLAAGAVLGMIGQRLVPREEVTGRLQEIVAARTGGILTPGRVGVRIWGGPGVVLRDGRLAGTGADLAARTGRPNDLGPYEVEYRRLEVRLDAAALLAGRLEWSGARLVASRVDVAWGGDLLKARDVEVALSGVTGATAEPGDLVADGDLRAATLDHDGCPWRDVRLTGHWAAGRSEDIRLQADLGDGGLEADLDWNTRADRGGRLSGRVVLTAAPAAELLAPYLPDLAARLRTDLSGEITGGLDLADRDVRLASLGLTGRLRGTPGELDAADWLREAGPYLGDRPDLVHIRFDRLEHDLVVRGGVYRLERLELAGPDTEWRATGAVAFDGKLDLAVHVRLPAGFTPELGAFSFLAESLRDDDGRVGLGLKVGGT